MLWVTLASAVNLILAELCGFMLAGDPANMSRIKNGEGGGQEIILPI